MNNIREIIGNATMAHTKMINQDINSKEVVEDIFMLIEDSIDSIEKANKIDVRNKNGFKINSQMLYKIKNQLGNLEDLYRKVIFMYKNEKNYIEGKQTDNLGTVCLIYDGNTYCLLELIVKAILTHNSIIIASESDYMKATNELIVLLVHRILKTYGIDKNLVQLLYTSEIEELLSNTTSINKVIVVGNKEFQRKIKDLSKIETIYKGYNEYDLYIEDNSNISLIKEILKENSNINLYVKEGIEIKTAECIEVADIDEAIAQINFNTCGYSSSIFTDDRKNASQFLKEVKCDNISVNSSPLLENLVDVDINAFFIKKNMLYPNPLKEDGGKNKVEFPIKNSEIKENTNKSIENELIQVKKQNELLKKNNEDLKNQTALIIKQKNEELNSMKKQLQEAHNLAQKYMNIFRNSFLSRLFGKLRKQDLDSDTKLLSE